MKKLVKKWLGMLGYEVRRLPPARPRPAPRSGSAVEHNSREQRERFYEDQSQVHEYLNDDRRQFYREITQLVGRARPGLGAARLRIADYGCGPGMLLKELSLTSPESRFFGYDFAAAGIRVARENFPEASFGERDIYQPFADRYDVVLCTEVLEHLERPGRALANLLDQVSPGGLLVLTVPDGRVDQYVGHIHFWSPESWKLFLEEACPGFAVETGRVTTRSGRAFLHACIGRAQPAISTEAIPATTARSAAPAGYA
jgi:2-polyprenyl-3-methyl-5-hydroxy-6-metoxy-1,4-benzoquinol methylase